MQRFKDRGLMGLVQVVGAARVRLTGSSIYKLTVVNRWVLYYSHCY